MNCQRREGTVDFEKFDPIHDVRSIVDGSLNDEIDNSNSNEDTDETWCTELLDALAKMSPKNLSCLVEVYSFIWELT